MREPDSAHPRMGMHRTEVDGWLAEWRIDRCGIRMISVCDGSDEPLVSFTAASAPDLVQMREQFPELERLWDAIRHAYWRELFGPRDIRVDGSSSRCADPSHCR
ncbi:hypothetical protein [Nocardia sp. NPDC052112]|uniref:hypothetical protein n=1 Tax=Nocardia sp. NPDC052112 TaxID=3155646 RepID=UPI00342D50E2